MYGQCIIYTLYSQVDLHHTIIGKGFDLLKRYPRICNKVCTPIAKYFVDNQPQILRLKMICEI
jgi:hypothetical protein